MFSVELTRKPSGTRRSICRDSYSSPSLTYQALGRDDEATRVAETACHKLLLIRGASQLPAAEAFLAELWSRPGRPAEAARWMEQSDPASLVAPGIGVFLPKLTMVKTLLRQRTTTSLNHAGVLLDELVPFLESTHSTRFLIEALALRSLVDVAQGDEAESSAWLERAISLAQPGGFVRLFVDLGPELAKLLNRIELDFVKAFPQPRCSTANPPPQNEFASLHDCPGKLIGQRPQAVGG